MDDLIPIQMTTRDRAHWLADKVSQYNDYTAEAIAMLRRLVDENERMRESLTYCIHAMHPYCDMKPRNWKTDAENLAIAYKIAVIALRGEKQ